MFSYSSLPISLSPPPFFPSSSHSTWRSHFTIWLWFLCSVSLCHLQTVLSSLPAASPGPWLYIPAPLHTSFPLKSHTNCVFLWPHSFKNSRSLDIKHIRWHAGSRESKITIIESQMRWSSQPRRVNKHIQRQNAQILVTLPFLVKREARFPETLS